MNELKPSNTCEDKIDRYLEGRMSDLRRLWAAYCGGSEVDDELGSLAEYSLCFDYVAPGTFDDQAEAYFRNSGAPANFLRRSRFPEHSETNPDQNFRLAWVLVWGNFSRSRRPASP